MRNRITKSIGALVLILMLAVGFVATTKSYAFPPEEPTGTCCPGLGTCVIGNYVEHNAYYLKNGPCPPEA